MIAVLLFFSMIGAVFYILFPFKKERSWDYSRVHNIFTLEEKKEASLIAIHDIDFEYAAGKISNEDYHNLRSYYKEDAIKVLREIKETEGKVSIWSLPPERDIDQSLKRELVEEVVRIQGLKFVNRIS